MKPTKLERIGEVLGTIVAISLNLALGLCGLALIGAMVCLAFNALTGG